MNDDERRQRLEDLAYEGEGDGEERTLEEVIAEYGFTPEELLEAAERGENPFAAKKAKKDDDKAKPGAGDPKAAGGDKAADPKKPCSCDKVEGKHTVGDHKKTSSSGEKPSEKKSGDDSSVAPEAGAEGGEPRSEDQDDAAQAGTSTGMSMNARERALSLLDLI